MCSRVTEYLCTTACAPPTTISSLPSSFLFTPSAERPCSGICKYFLRSNCNLTLTASMKYPCSACRNPTLPQIHGQIQGCIFRMAQTRITSPITTTETITVSSQKQHCSKQEMVTAVEDSEIWTRKLTLKMQIIR